MKFFNGGENVTAWQIALAIILIIISIIIVVVVLMQKDREGTINGAIGGGDSSGSQFFGKAGSNRKDAVLEKITVALSIIAAILILVVFFLNLFLK